MSDEAEGREGVKRVEAFSDGVIAIVITIMVLEMHAPEQSGLAHLWPMWPVFTAYALSYAYVAIYWVNHHRLFHNATRVTNALVWSNIALLFALSLVPFATAYLGRQAFSRDATLLYMTVMMLPSFAYLWLQTVIRATGRQDEEAADYHRRTMRKGLVASLIYALGIPLTLVSPALGLACAGIVAILWFLPRKVPSTGCSAPSGGNMPKAKIDPAAALTGSSYPPPFDQALAGRKSWILTRQLDLTDFGVNRVELAPGAWSTQRHWHKYSDEVVVVVSGELVMVTDDGEEVLRAGDCAGFKAGVPNAHHLQNRSDAVAVYYDIGGRSIDDVSTFPDMGMETKLHFQNHFRPIREK